jgi:15-cis-phytoene synthase
MQVEQAYAEVERVTRARAKNFAYGIMVLPKPKRRAVAAIYAFARQVDDVADGDLPIAEKRARLESLRSLTGVGAMHVALADAMTQFPIRRDALEKLVDGGLQDLEQTRYASFADLHGYCEKVAGAVGVACIGVYGSDDVRHAETLGIALQLINIMRDVREDWELGRVYLPQDELATHGVDEDDIATGRVTAAWRSLMDAQAARARAFLAEGRELLPTLDRRSALCVSAFAGLYEATLNRIEASAYDVFGARPSMSGAAKLAVVARGLVR